MPCKCTGLESVKGEIGGPAALDHQPAVRQIITMDLLIHLCRGETVMGPARHKTTLQFFDGRGHHHGQVEEICQTGPAPLLQQQVVALGDDDAIVSGDTPGSRYGELPVSVKDRDEYLATSLYGSQQIAQATNVEGVWSTFPRQVASLLQDGIVEMKAVHRQNSAAVPSVDQDLVQPIRQCGLACTGRPGDGHEQTGAMLRPSLDFGDQIVKRWPHAARSTSGAGRAPVMKATASDMV